MKSLRFFKLLTVIFILNQIMPIFGMEGQSSAASSALSEQDNKRNNDARSAAINRLKQNNYQQSRFRPALDDEDMPGLGYAPNYSMTPYRQPYLNPMQQYNYVGRLNYDENRDMGLRPKLDQIRHQSVSKSHKTLKTLSIDALLKKINEYIAQLNGELQQSEINRLNEEIDAAIAFIQSQYLSKENLQEKVAVKLKVLEAFRESTNYFYKVFDLIEDSVAEKKANREFVNQNFAKKEKKEDKLAKDYWTKMFAQFWNKKIKNEEIDPSCQKTNFARFMANGSIDAILLYNILGKTVDSNFVNFLCKIWPNRFEGNGIINTVKITKLLISLVASGYINKNNLSLNKLMLSAVYLSGKAVSTLGNVTSWAGRTTSGLSDLRDKLLG